MTTPAIFCDGIAEISFVNGVLRMHLVQTQGNNTNSPAGTVLMPLNLALPLAEHLMNAARQIAQQTGTPLPPTPSAPAPTQAGADFLASIPKLT